MEIKHLLAELYGCNSSIRQEDSLRAALRRGIDKAGATIVSDAAIAYVPHGLTIVYFLAESHVIATTWPEHDLVLLDLLLCNPVMEPRHVLDEMTALLDPAREVRVREVLRTVAPHPVDASRVPRMED